MESGDGPDQSIFEHNLVDTLIFKILKALSGFTG